VYELKPVSSPAQWTDFIDLPWSIYKGDPHWVPPLKIAVRDVLDVAKNPFFKHSTMYPIVAYKDGKCVGRVVGIVDENHNRHHEEKAAFFGFYESINDPALTQQLLDAVTKWATERGMTMLRGPANPSSNHEWGLLVEGFQDSPNVMMTYNPPYYADLFEGWGLKKAKDLYAYVIKRGNRMSDRIVAHSEKLKTRNEVTFREAKMSEFDKEVDIILDIYNDAWEKNWGFVPMEPAEFRHLAKDLKMIVDPRLLLIAEVRGEPVGFALTLPDVNQAFKKVKDGKLFPTGLFKILWNTKGPGRRSTINRCRIVTLGVRRSHQHLGLGPLFYSEYFKRGPALGYPSGEASWILEDNKSMNRAIEMLGGERTKVYRVYDRPLA
jgi:hypothetical protein